MINDHDLALIAQLADGTIDPDDEAAARALIDGSPAARAEYDAQLVALAALRNAGTARMTTAERSTLHGTLVDRLGLNPAPEPEPIRRRWTVPWGGLAVAAAALVGVVLLAPVLGLLSTDGDGDSADPGFLASEQRSTTAPVDGAALGEADAEDEGSGLDDVPLGAVAPSATEEALATTVAPEASAADSYRDFGGALPYLGRLEADDLAGLQERVLTVPGDASAWRFDLSSRSGAAPAGDPLLKRLAERAGCAAGIPDGFEADAVAFAEISSITAVLYRLEAAAGSPAPSLLVLDLDTCAEVAGIGGG